jgi:hypothetical protein
MRALFLGLVSISCAAATPPAACPCAQARPTCPDATPTVAVPPSEDEPEAAAAVTAPAPNPSLDPTACYVGKIEACRIRCDAGEAHGCAELGKSMIWGVGVPVDSHLGYAQLDKACQQDHAESCFLVGQWLTALSPMALRDDVRGRTLIDKSCKHGYGIGCATMANLLDATHQPGASEYVVRACDLGVVSSCHQLGR